LRPKFSGYGKTSFPQTDFAALPKVRRATHVHREHAGSADGT
jgi:hypothetical protein